MYKDPYIIYQMSDCSRDKLQAKDRQKRSMTKKATRSFKNIWSAKVFSAPPNSALSLRPCHQQIHSLGFWYWVYNNHNYYECMLLGRLYVMLCNVNTTLCIAPWMAAPLQVIYRPIYFYRCFTRMFAVIAISMLGITDQVQFKLFIENRNSEVVQRALQRRCGYTWPWVWGETKNHFASVSWKFRTRFTNDLFLRNKFGFCLPKFLMTFF